MAEPFLLGATLTYIVGANSPVWRNVRPIDLTSSSTTYVPSGPGIPLSRTGAPIPNDIQHNGLWSCVQQDHT